MLQEKIKNDLKEAMKSKDALKVSCLRMILADMKNTAIAKQEELKDEDIVQIFQKQMKQRKDSIESFKKGNRQDLVDKETKELKIIQEYLPEQLPASEIAKIVKEAIAKTGVTDKKDMGKVMGAVMPKVKGRANGKLINQEVIKQLSANGKK